MLFNAWIQIIAERRRELGITVEEAVKDAGVSTSTWYRWASGSVYVPAEGLEPLARGLRMEADELALLYCETMTRHYRERVDGARHDGIRRDDTGEPTATEPVPVELGAPPFEIRGVASAGGVWVNLNDVLGRISEAKAAERPRTRPRRHRPWKGPMMIRRKKR